MRKKLKDNIFLFKFKKHYAQERKYKYLIFVEK